MKIKFEINNNEILKYFTVTIEDDWTRFDIAGRDKRYFKEWDILTNWVSWQITTEFLSGKNALMEKTPWRDLLNNKQDDRPLRPPTLVEWLEKLRQDKDLVKLFNCLHLFDLHHCHGSCFCLSVWGMTLVDANCSTLLGQYLSCFMVFLKNSHKRYRLFKSIVDPPLIRTVPRILHW